MEILGRFPAVALDAPGGEPPAATAPGALPAEPAPPPRRGRRATDRPATPPVAFPVRSVAALAVLTVVVWVVTLRHEAARRAAADGVRAATIASDPRENIAK